jgi:S-adenosylmethionine/arginine decarboxylase-like enzyme
MPAEKVGSPQVLIADTVLSSGSPALYHRLRELGVDAEVSYAEGPRAEGKTFGTLLALDLYDCPAEPLASIETGYRFLEGLADHLGMATQSPPFIFLSDAKKYPDKAGLSGWVPLIESGITLHTLLPTNFATIDVYSCKPVPAAETIAFACSFFSPKKIEATYLHRGREYSSIGIQPAK